MMLKGQPGCGVTGCGRLPGGASQCSRSRPAVEPSSVMRGMPSGSGAISSAAAASANNSIAPASSIMRARLAGVAPGASGATATPARSAPRNTAA